MLRCGTLSVCLFFLASIGLGEEIQKDKRCDLPLDAGSCSDTVTRWYFDSSKGECLQFLYNGCGGNNNRFYTQEGCLINCAGITDPAKKPKAEEKNSATKAIEEQAGGKKEPDEESDIEEAIPKEMKDQLSSSDREILDEVISQADTYKMEAMQPQESKENDEQEQTDQLIDNEEKWESAKPSVLEPDVPEAMMTNMNPDDQETMSELMGVSETYKMVESGKIEPALKDASEDDSGKNSDYEGVQREDFNEKIPDSGKKQTAQRLIRRKPEAEDVDTPHLGGKFDYDSVSPEDKDVLQDLVSQSNTYELKESDEEQPRAEQDEQDTFPEDTPSGKTQEIEDRELPDNSPLEQAALNGNFDDTILDQEDRETLTDIMENSDVVTSDREGYNLKREFKTGMTKSDKPKIKTQTTNTDYKTIYPMPTYIEGPQQETMAETETSLKEKPEFKDAEEIITDAESKGILNAKEITKDNREALDELISQSDVYELEKKSDFEDAEDKYSDPYAPLMMGEDIDKREKGDGINSAEDTPTSDNQWVPSPMCLLPMETGPCKANIPRWYYDVERGECVHFTYGGCLGNANRFLNPDVCISVCSELLPLHVCKRTDKNENDTPFDEENNPETYEEMEENTPDESIPMKEIRRPQLMTAFTMSFPKSLPSNDRISRPKQIAKILLSMKGNPWSKKGDSRLFGKFPHQPVRRPEIKGFQRPMHRKETPVPFPLGKEFKRPMHRKEIPVPFSPVKGFQRPMPRQEQHVPFPAPEGFQRPMPRKEQPRPFPAVDKFQRPMRRKETPSQFSAAKEFHPPLAGNEQLPFSTLTEGFLFPIFKKSPDQLFSGISKEPQRPMPMPKNDPQSPYDATAKQFLGPPHRQEPESPLSPIYNPAMMMKWPKFGRMMRNHMMPDQIIAPRIHEQRHTSHQKEDNRYQTHTKPENKVTLFQVFMNKPNGRSHSGLSHGRMKPPKPPASDMRREMVPDQAIHHHHHYPPHHDFSPMFGMPHRETSRPRYHPPMSRFAPPRNHPRMWAPIVIIRRFQDESPAATTMATAKQNKDSPETDAMSHESLDANETPQEPESAIEVKENDETVPDFCDLPVAQGFCKAAELRYYYNKEKKDCDEFYYGGCGGNANRFETIEACRSSCLVGQDENADFNQPIVVTVPMFVPDSEVKETNQNDEPEIIETTTTPLVKPPENTKDIASAKGTKAQNLEAYDGPDVFGVHLRGGTEYLIILIIMCVVGFAVIVLVIVSIAHLCRKCRSSRKETIAEPGLKKSIYEDSSPPVIYTVTSDHADVHKKIPLDSEQSPEPEKKMY